MRRGVHVTPGGLQGLLPLGEGFSLSLRPGSSSHTGLVHGVERGEVGMQARALGAAVASGLLIIAGASAPANADAGLPEEATNAPVIATLGGFQLLGAPVSQGVTGQGWQAGETVALFYNDWFVGESTAEPNDEGSATPAFDTEGLGITLQPGDEVRLVGDDSGSFTHEILDLTVRDVSDDKDTVRGTATPGSQVLVLAVQTWRDLDTAVPRWVTADKKGEWLADFSVAGDDPEHTATADITNATLGFAARFDDEGNMTNIWWAPPDVVKQKVTYTVTDGVVEPEIADPGMLNFGECGEQSGGSGWLYTLFEGTNSQDWTFTYEPSRPAFQSGQPGSSLSIDVKSKFKGLFERQDQPGLGLYELKTSGDLMSSMQITNDEDGATAETVTFRLIGEFLDAATGEPTGDYYNLDFTETCTSDGECSWTGVDDGTCTLH